MWILCPITHGFLATGLEPAQLLTCWLSVVFVIDSNEKRERGNYLYARNDCTRAIDVYLK